MIPAGFAGIFAILATASGSERRESGGIGRRAGLRSQWGNP